MAAAVGESIISTTMSYERGVAGAREAQYHQIQEEEITAIVKLLKQQNQYLHEREGEFPTPVGVKVINNAENISKKFQSCIGMVGEIQSRLVVAHSSAMSTIRELREGKTLPSMHGLNAPDSSLKVLQHDLPKKRAELDVDIRELRCEMRKLKEILGTIETIEHLWDRSKAPSDQQQKALAQYMHKLDMRVGKGENSNCFLHPSSSTRFEYYWELQKQEGSTLPTGKIYTLTSMCEEVLKDVKECTNRIKNPPEMPEDEDADRKEPFPAPSSSTDGNKVWF